MTTETPTNDIIQGAEMPDSHSEYILASSWERVKYEILNRFYELNDYFRSYQFHVMSGKDPFQHRQMLTSMITSLWFLMRDYKKTYTDIKNWDDFDKFLSKNTIEKTALNYEGIIICMKTISTMCLKGGLTNIQFEKKDKGKAILEY